MRGGLCMHRVGRVLATAAVLTYKAFLLLVFVGIF